MRKTLLVTVDYPPAFGGVATYWGQVVKGVSGESLSVLAQGQPQESDPSHVLRSDLFFHFFWPKWLKGVFTIRKLISEQGINQILVGQVLPVGTMVWLLSYFTKLDYIVQVYGMDLKQAALHKRKAWLAKQVLKRAKSVVVNSHSVGEVLDEFMGMQVAKTVVYPIPEKPSNVDSALLDSLIHRYSLADKCVVLTTSRLVERKGIDQMIKAMNSVVTSFPKAIYVIVGDGPDRSRLEQLAHHQKDRILFLGNQSQQEKEAWYELAELFVLPTRPLQGDIEGFGMVYLEAAWHGVPSIAGNSGGVTEAVIDKQTGLCVDPTNSQNIASVVISLLENPAYAKELGQNAKRRLEHDLTWEQSLSHLKKALA